MDGRYLTAYDGKIASSNLNSAICPQLFLQQTRTGNSSHQTQLTAHTGCLAWILLVPPSEPTISPLPGDCVGSGHKGPDGPASENRRRKPMRLITPDELSIRTDLELQSLFNSVSRELTQTKANSAERRNALATLENIERVRARKLSPRWC